jgi:hypothetical protein
MPFVACIQCGGSGKLTREVDDAIDKMAHMSAVSVLYRRKKKPTTSELAEAKKIEAAALRDERGC